MKVLVIFLFASVVAAMPDPGALRSTGQGVKEGRSTDSASLPFQGVQPMFLYLPDYTLQAPLDIPGRRPFHRINNPLSSVLNRQRPFRPQQHLLPTQSYGQTFQTMPILLPVPLPMLPAQKALELDISDWLAGIEESIKLDEESVVLASSDSRKTSLLLKPVAKAVAGPKGVAVASPVAQAILRRGQPVTIDFDPDAVAIAGPGGSADAQPKLIISYADESQNLSALTSTTSDDLTAPQSTTQAPQSETTSNSQ